MINEEGKVDWEENDYDPICLVANLNKHCWIGIRMGPRRPNQLGLPFPVAAVAEVAAADADCSPYFSEVKNWSRWESPYRQDTDGGHQMRSHRIKILATWLPQQQSWRKRTHELTNFPRAGCTSTGLSSAVQLVAAVAIAAFCRYRRSGSDSTLGDAAFSRWANIGTFALSCEFARAHAHAKRVSSAPATLLAFTAILALQRRDHRGNELCITDSVVVKPIFMASW